MSGMKKMNKDSVYYGIWKIFVAVVIFCYMYFFGYGVGDFVLSGLVTLTILGLSEIIGSIFVIIFYLSLKLWNKIRSNK
jgi:hypothetical protein